MTYRNRRPFRRYSTIMALNLMTAWLWLVRTVRSADQRARPLP